MVGDYGLHPLSVVCLSRVLSAEFIGKKNPDLVLQALAKVSLDTLQADFSDIPTPVFTKLQTMSKAEWIITLLQVCTSVM